MQKQNKGIRNSTYHSFVDWKDIGLVDQIRKLVTCAKPHKTGEVIRDSKKNMKFVEDKSDNA